MASEVFGEQNLSPQKTQDKSSPSDQAAQAICNMEFQINSNWSDAKRAPLGCLGYLLGMIY